jgi:hypothetical protein
MTTAFTGLTVEIKELTISGVTSPGEIEVYECPPNAYAFLVQYKYQGSNNDALNRDRTTAAGVPVSDVIPSNNGGDNHLNPYSDNFSTDFRLFTSGQKLIAGRADGGTNPRNGKFVIWEFK